MQNKILILGGPTASGKSALAIDLARKIDGVIINADSQQVYREIPIITAQPDAADLQKVPHRLYGIISALDFFSVALWLELVEKEIREVLAIGKTPILVGGTGMYIKSLVEGIAIVPEISAQIRQQIRERCDTEGSGEIHKILMEKDPQVAAKLNPGDRQRVLRAYEVLLQTGKSLQYWHEQKSPTLFPKEMFEIFFLFPDRQETYAKCDKRLLQMLDIGLLAEIENLGKLQISPKLPAMRGHGIREFLAYLRGELSLDTAIAAAQQNTRNYVKRQFTWFGNQMMEAKRIGVADVELFGFL